VGRSNYSDRQELLVLPIQSDPPKINLDRALNFFVHYSTEPSSLLRATVAGYDAYFS